MRRSGLTLVELLIAMLVGLIVGAALASTIYFAYRAEDSLEGENITNTSLRQVLDTMGDAIRNAQIGATSAAVQAGSVSDITVFTSGSGDTRRFWLDSSVSPPIVRSLQTTSGASQTTTVQSGINSLAYKYFLCGGSYYAPSSSWTTTVNPNQPSASELSNVGAIEITAAIAVRSYTRQMSAFVRLRNVPLRTRL